jgi:hypothetical protein
MWAEEWWRSAIPFVERIPELRTARIPVGLITEAGLIWERRGGLVDHLVTLFQPRRYEHVWR